MSRVICAPSSATRRGDGLGGDELGERVGTRFQGAATWQPECIQPVAVRVPIALIWVLAHGRRIRHDPRQIDASFSAILVDDRPRSTSARKNRVFCNRNLRMDQIEMIGFDMDYTLALYHQDATRAAVDRADARQADREARLPARRSASSSYDPRWAIRGCVDRQAARQRLQDRPPRLRRARLPRHARAHAATSASGSTARRRSRLSTPRYAVDRHAVRSARGGHVHRRWSTALDSQRRPVDYDKLFGDIRARASTRRTATTR